MEEHTTFSGSQKGELPDSGVNDTLSIQAFEALFHQYYSYLCLTATAILKDREAAEDLVQEFYIIYWNKQTYQLNKTNFRAYAKRAITNDCIDYLRKQKVNEKRNSLINSPVEHDPQIDSDREEQEREQYQKILDLVAELPESRRQILILHAVDQLSYNQIAEKQGVSINTVRTQLSRAYKSLRNHESLILLSILMKF